MKRHSLKERRSASARQRALQQKRERSCAAKDPSDKLESRLQSAIPDLITMSRRLAACRGSSRWSQASRLAGPAIASATAALSTPDPSKLVVLIRDRFRPERNARACATMPAQHAHDLAIRAVAAQAVLGRFDRCMDYVAELHTGADRSEPPRRFSPDDLLQEMSRQVKKPCDSDGDDESPGRLEDLIAREAASRLGLAKPNQRLVARVKRHLAVFQTLANADRA